MADPAHAVHGTRAGVNPRPAQEGQFSTGLDNLATFIARAPSEDFANGSHASTITVTERSSPRVC
jgi:hypothetical protein